MTPKAPHSGPSAGKLLLLLLLILLGAGAGASSAGLPQESWDEDYPILYNRDGERRFTYYRNEAWVQFNLVKRDGVERYTGTIFQIHSNSKKEYSLILNYRVQGPSELLVVTSNQVYSFEFQPDTDIFAPHDTLLVGVALNLKKDNLRIATADTSFTVHSLGFKINSGYEFIFPPNRFLQDNPNEMAPLLVRPLQTGGDSEQTTNSKLWFWFLLVLMVDIVIFMVIQVRRAMRRRSLRRKKDELLQANQSLAGIADRAFEGPTKSAIYLFGGFRVFDATGEDITKKFSPLLKELFLLILLNSSAKGISTQKIKDALWFDKTDRSAKNNLFVNIGKLRQLLDSVGGYQLINRTTSWEILFDDIYVDYNSYLALLMQQGDTSAESVRKMMGIIARGQLLGDCHYDWLDKFKATATDGIFDTIMGFAQTLSVATDSSIVLDLCRVLLSIDSLNEQVVELKCRALIVQGKHSQAKSAFEQFTREYEALYGTKFDKSFAAIG